MNKRYRVEIKPSEAQRVAAMTVRRVVFIEEQAVAESIEQDGRDDEASHVVVVDQHHRVVATGRILISDDGSAKIQRVAVLKTLRGEGVGRLVMEGLEHSSRTQGASIAKLASQIEAVGFYERLGYEAYGEPFYEANILHRWMKKRI